jgi:erythromycin esterase
MSILKFSLRRTAVCLAAAWLLIPAGRLVCQEADPEAPPSWTGREIETIVEWLGERAIPLESVEAGSGFEDLQALRPLLERARIVALGEATHGTREFFQLKHRMLEFLVKEMGFTVFAIEASYPACQNINEYVLEGKGDPAAALASQGFWTWDTHEVRDMIAWMRDYNSDVPDDRKVMFVGYDIQHLERAVTDTIEYLERLDPKMVPAARAALEPLADYEGVRELVKPENQGRRDEVLAAYMDFMAQLDFFRNRFIRLSSEKEYEAVKQLIRVMGQYFTAYTTRTEDPETAARFSRDAFMAENIAWWMRILKPGTKMVVWAHNGHVKVGKLGPLPCMGAYLREWYGDAYYTLGFSFNQGSFQSCDLDAAQRTSAGCILTEFTLGPAAEGTADWFFARAGFPAFIVDFSSSPDDGVVGRWLSEPIAMRSIGSGFSTKMAGRFLDRTRLMPEYDGMIFIDRTTRARPNPTGMRPKQENGGGSE